MMYVALKKTLKGAPKIYSMEDAIEILDNTVDYYTTLYYFNEEQKNHIIKENSFSGIEDTKTNRLYFDFDNESNLEAARSDAVSLIYKLTENGLTENQFKIWFTGKKGFAVQINLHRWITPLEFKTAVFKLAGDYKTFDKVVNDPVRIIRMENTKHPSSGLYKIPLELHDLETASIESIQDVAKSPYTIEQKVEEFLNLSEEYFVPETVKIEPKETNDVDIDFSKKVKGWSNCKWALTQGYEIKEGNRKQKLLCIVATAKALNYTKEQAYYTAKDASEKGAILYNESKFDKGELWHDVVKSVYGEKWNGGAFTCKDNKTPWLKEVCNSLGVHKCDVHSDKSPFVDVDKVFDDFQDFAVNIEKNTIKTGIPRLDERVRFRTGQMIGLLAAPSAGKSSLALEILENTSKNGILSVFYSLDMSSSEMFQRLAQHVTGYEEKHLYKLFQSNSVELKEIRDKVTERYGKVKFCFDTGISAESIQTSIDDFEKQSGDKVRLLLIDYNELLSSPYSDPTANSAHNIGLIKRLTNLNNLCTISLLQPPKVVGDASDPITSYRSIKGSSLLEQCFSIVIGLFRPGFSPKNNSDKDKFMVMNVLKNRLGKLCSMHFHWDGLRGQISDIMDQESEDELMEMLERKQAEKDNQLF